MNFTDIFIKRPVLASVISILIFVLGLRSIASLQLSQYPKMVNTVITITTAYPGASADLMQGFVTKQIEQSVASADGIDYMTASSTAGTSTINVYVKLNFPPNDAFTSVMSKVAAVTNLLPPEAEQPVLEKETGNQISLMYLGFYSKEMTEEQIGDYLLRVVQPRLETVSGVASANILGDSTYAMRIWLQPERMAALGVTPNDVATALQSKNFQTAAGVTKGKYVSFNIVANTDLHTPKEFQDIVIKNNGSSLVRLGDVAKIELGSQSYSSNVVFNGEKAVFIGIDATPIANPLEVISNIRKMLPEIEKNFPTALSAKVAYDATEYIRASIHEVIATIIEAVCIVIVVVFLFLGSLRSVIIPVVTIPLSLIGVCTLMLILGYSINLLTLLAMVLAIGMVVDDAIVVVENIHRHIEEGMTPFNAAITGAREIAAPIISMTLTLAAVYAPIGFMGGVTGSLFTEFAFTLAAAVIISGVIALTLSPMMCSRLLTAGQSNQRFVKFLDDKFHLLKERYQRLLHGALNYRPVTVLFAVVVLTSCYFLFVNTPSELAPDEDQSVLFVAATAPEYATIDYTSAFTRQFNEIYESFPEMEDYFIVNGSGAANSVISGIILKPWNQRKRTQAQINPILQQKMNNVAGLKVAVFPLPSLPVGTGSLPIQFVISTTDDYQKLYQVSQQLYNKAKNSGLFLFVDNSLKFDKPQVELVINRDKAASMGISMQDIGNALATSLGGNYVNFFSLANRSYRVIPQLMRKYRLTAEQLNNIYIRTSSNQLIPLSTVASLDYQTIPSALEEFNQLNSTTIEGVMMPGQSMGTVLNYLMTEADRILPKGYSYDFAEQSRQYIEEGSSLIYTFFFAIIIIFLVLSAQFESFRDPFVILISVPMSICGALIFLNLGLATINIYTQVGLITLIGLISKHGILMVDFANHLQEKENLGKRAAIEKAASIRLRPILMTTAAMVMGVVPLVLAKGAGAVSRFDIGLVISTGMLIGTLFTLFVVPTMYTFIASDKRKEDKI